MRTIWAEVTPGDRRQSIQDRKANRPIVVDPWIGGPGVKAGQRSSAVVPSVFGMCGCAPYDPGSGALIVSKYGRMILA